MSDCFLYFRCWPGIIAGFPVEEFNPLRNDEIEPALNRFAMDWFCSHRVEVCKLAKQRVVTRREASKRRRGVTASRPDGKWGPRPQRPSVRTRRAPRQSLFRRVGDYAGWFDQKSLIFEDKESGEVKSAGPLVAVYHTSDQEFSEKVVSALNCDWSKYESGYPRRDYDPTSGALGEPLFHLETELNPRFGLLHARDASRERFHLMMLQVANMEKNEPPNVLHPDLHLAVAQRAMRVIDQMEAAATAKAPPNDLPASPAAQPPEAAAEENQEPRIPVCQSKKVKLFGPGEQPEVNGKRKSILTAARYDAVQALIEAGETGLTKDQIDSKSGHTDARKLLKALADDDADWAKVILFPGTPGKGYRIR